MDSVESVVLVLRSMDGVAHTMGSDIYKEIHFSLEWIAQHAHRAKDEIQGVLVHEMVHCYQHDGNGTCPTGFTEGVAGTYTYCHVISLSNVNFDNLELM